MDGQIVLFYFYLILFLIDFVVFFWLFVVYQKVYKSLNYSSVHGEKVVDEYCSVVKCAVCGS